MCSKAGIGMPALVNIDLTHFDGNLQFAKKLTHPLKPPEEFAPALNVNAAA